MAKKISSGLAKNRRKKLKEKHLRNLRPLVLKPDASPSGWPGGGGGGGIGNCAVRTAEG